MQSPLIDPVRFFSSRRARPLFFERPRLDELPDLLDPHHLDRATGVLVGLLKLGPAAPRSRLYGVLKRAGVLGLDPRESGESAAVARLPWGGQRVGAPAPQRPPEVAGPWPQEPHVNPGFYPPVLSTEVADRTEHFSYNVTRYLGQSVNLLPRAAARALWGPRLLPIDDREFARMLFHTSFGQFLRHEIEEADLPSFAPDLRGDRSRYLTMDLSFCPTEHLLPGLHAAPSVSLFEREGDGMRPVAIRIRDRVFRPGDGSPWELARYFALQGAQCRMVASAHPRIHFGVDALNAITRSSLPPHHVIRRLLRPHMRFTLGLHEAVIHHRRSPIHNSQREIYTPFPFTGDGMHAMVTAGRQGVPGRRAYPPYRFDEPFLGDHIPYGRYRRDWYEHTLRFVREVVAGVDSTDFAVRGWADHVAAWVPGFPAGDEIFEGDNLACALARYICTVSVFHTGDHHSFSNLPLAKLPFRLRCPPPDQQTPPPQLDLGSLVDPEDFLRHRLSHRMFYRPVLLQRLRDVRYDLGEAHRGAVERFSQGMAALDRRWAGSRSPLSSQIATSLQY